MMHCHDNAVYTRFCLRLTTAAQPMSSQTQGLQHLRTTLFMRVEKHFNKHAVVIIPDFHEGGKLYLNCYE